MIYVLWDWILSSKWIILNEKNQGFLDWFFLALSLTKSLGSSTVFNLLKTFIECSFYCFLLSSFI